MNFASWSNRVRRFKWRVRFLFLLSFSDFILSFLSWSFEPMLLACLSSPAFFFCPAKKNKKKLDVRLFHQPSTNAPNHAFSRHRASEFARKNLIRTEKASYTHTQYISSTKCLSQFPPLLARESSPRRTSALPLPRKEPRCKSSPKENSGAFSLNFFFAQNESRERARARAV